MLNWALLTHFSTFLVSGVSQKILNHIWFRLHFRKESRPPDSQNCLPPDSSRTFWFRPPDSFVHFELRPPDSLKSSPRRILVPIRIAHIKIKTLESLKKSHQCFRNIVYLILSEFHSNWWINKTTVTISLKIHMTMSKFVYVYESGGRKWVGGTRIPPVIR